VDFNKIIERVKAILLTPKTEWPVIAGESTTVADLYKNYIVWLAAIPALALLIGTFGIFGLKFALSKYIISLVMVFVGALIIDALAPTFGGQKNQIQALKTVAYSGTAPWLAGVVMVVPLLGVLLGWIVMVAASVYAIYLIYLALPHTMKCPPEKAGAYTAVTVIAVIVGSWILGLILGSVLGLGMLGNNFGSAHFGSSADTTTFDKDSALGKAEAWSKKMEAASKQMDAAQKSGDADAAGKAMGAMMGAALGGGDKVEALAPDVLKPFVPETLAGLKRTDISVERNGAMGMQVSTANATYSDGSGHTLRLEVTDTGSAKGLMGLAGWAAVQNDRETDHGYEKTYKQDGRLVHEQWDSNNKDGEYGIVLGDRFAVKVSGNADSMDQLKSALAGINLAGLEALKNQGVVKNG